MARAPERSVAKTKAPMQLALPVKVSTTRVSTSSFVDAELSPETPLGEGRTNKPPELPIADVTNE